MSFSIGGAHLGSILAGRKEKQAEGLMEDALRQAKKAKVPTIEEQMVELFGPEYQGNLTPEMLQSIGMGDTEMENISMDPRLRQAQMSALEQLAGLSESGLSMGDLAMIQQGQRAASSQNQAQQGQILQEMQQRGIGGSGAELAARLSASQESADRLGANSLDTVRAAQERALQAMSQSGSMAGQIRSQDYGIESDKARAQEAINQFNVQNQQQVQQANINAKNQAAERNLAEKQRISEQQQAIKNQQEIQNKALHQQQFQNQIARGQNVQAPLTNMANMYNQQGAQTAQSWAAAGQGTDQMVGSMMGGMAAMSDKNIKVNIENGQNASRDFLDKLSPSKFEYSPEYAGQSPMSPQGEHLGVMAQDLEKAGPIGQGMVQELPTGEKAVNYGQAMGTMLANQADLNDRIKKLEQLLTGMKNVR